MSNQVGDYFKFLWPFQNVWTLPGCSSRPQGHDNVNKIGDMKYGTPIKEMMALACEVVGPKFVSN